jgi:predicted DNA-binding ribbon-helix-helix protein
MPERFETARIEAEIAQALTGGVAVRKRSVVLAGHRTSLSLEDAFWTAAKDEATRRGLSVNALIAAIDRARGEDAAAGLAGNLSAAVRVFLLAQARRRRDAAPTDSAVP